MQPTTGTEACPTLRRNYADIDLSYALPGARSRYKLEPKNSAPVIEHHLHADPGLSVPPIRLTNRALRPAPDSLSPLRRDTPPCARTVRPEILDALPPAAPAARASRRDLRIINGLLGSTSWFRRALREHHQSGEHVLEIGAGDGELSRALGPIAPLVAGLDLGRRPADWPQLAPWFETDVRDFTHWADYPIVVANLFLHHFDAAELPQLGARLGAHARVIIASDPLRSRRTWALFALLGPLIRAHPVTRHDGRVSIAAGFRRDELPRLLQLDPAAWTWRVEETWLGSSRLVAERRT